MSEAVRWISHAGRHHSSNQTNMLKSPDGDDIVMLTGSIAAMGSRDHGSHLLIATGSKRKYRRSGIELTA